ncbi:MAG: hypothetical protein RJA67_985 [Bacteroidota bacterium]|jgi:hypothetical protein
MEAKKGANAPFFDDCKDESIYTLYSIIYTLSMYRPLRRSRQTSLFHSLRIRRMSM